MQKRIFHLSFCFVLLLSLDCFAGGTYQVGQDQGGVYFQTDNDGGWYIGKSDLKDFKIGQTGTYSIEKDRNGAFLLTDKNRKFYLDTKAKEKQDIENAKVNQEYERKMEIMRQKEARTNAEQARLKAQEQEARAERELYQKIEEQKLEENRRLNQEMINARNREAEQSKRPNFGRSHIPAIPDVPQYRSQGAINPYTGEYYPSTGDGGLIRPRDGTYYAPAGPGGVINTRTGEFVPTGP